MALPTLPGDEKRKHLNPDQKDYDRKFNAIARQESEGTFNDIANNYDQTADGSQEDANVDAARRKLQDNEAQGDDFASGGWRTQVDRKINIKGNTAKRLRSRWALFGGLGLLGGGGIGAVFFFILTLQGNMFLNNITEMASQIPGYAMERRTEYMMTRLLATHLLRHASGATGTDSDADAKMVFCKNASISCSLFSTYGADYFDKLIDVEFKERVGSNARITITPKGRTSLGGNARSWDMVISRDLGDGQLIQTVKSITDDKGNSSNRAAKEFVKNLVNKNLHTKSYATRYIARTILMKKYGITHFRAFEKTSNKIDEVRTKIKSTILKNTVGKVSARMSLYLGCLTDSSLCSQLKENLKLDASAIQERLDAEKAKDNPNEKEIAKLEKALSGISSLTTNSSELSDADLKDGSLSKIIMKRLFAVAGAIGAVLMLDMAFGVIEGVDDHAIDEIVADVRKVTYIQFAFGDEVGIAPNVSKLMAGDQDLEVYGEFMSLFNGAEKSPLMQYENGVISAEEVTSQSYSVECNSEKGTATTALSKGQLTCPEQTIVSPVPLTQFLKSMPGWAALATLARLWNAGPGIVIDAVGDAVSDIITAIGGDALKWISDQVSALAGPAIEWVMGLFFIPPNVGFDASGAANYVGLSGGIRTVQNDLAEQGVDPLTGKANGIGGTVLSSTQQVAIENYYRGVEKENFDNQSLVAQIFNPNLKYSFAQQFIARMPTTLSGALALPITGMGYALKNSGSSALAATDVTVNPHNLPRYGYALNSSVFESDPGEYTNEKCSELAQAREESYGIHEGVSPIRTYSKADPCALEKSVVGLMLQAQGVTDDPNSLEQPGAAEETQDGSGTRGDYPRPENVVDRGKGWSTKPGADYSATLCDPRTGDTQGQIVTSPSNGSKIRVCRISNDKWPGGSEASVASIISRNVIDMFEDAHAAGVPIGISSGFRSNSTTEHGKGLAMDLKSVKTGFSICYVAGGSKYVWDSCDQGRSSEHPDEIAAFKWLQQNGAKYGFYNLAGTPLWEPWHWSTSGN